MIGRLTGTLYEKMPPRIGLDVQGVGYEIDVSMTTFYALPELGAQVTILTHLTVREDAHILFGFSSAQERAAFRELVKVSGIGARTALAVLSGMSVADLAQAITLQERLYRVGAADVARHAERLGGQPNRRATRFDRVRLFRARVTHGTKNASRGRERV